MKTNNDTKFIFYVSKVHEETYHFPKLLLIEIHQRYDFFKNGNFQAFFQLLSVKIYLVEVYKKLNCKFFNFIQNVL